MNYNLIDLITNLDFFGQGIYLTINKLRKSSTFFGGTLSITLILLLLSMFWFSVHDVLYHTNPSVSIEEQILDITPTLLLSYKDMGIAMALTGNSNSAIYIPEYFTYSITHFYGLTANNLNQTEYELINCEKDNFIQLSNDIFYKLEMHNYFCVSLQNFSLTGSWGEEYISYIELGIAYCQNSTNNNYSCSSKEEINEYLTNNTFFWNFYFMDGLINPQKSVNPITYHLRNLYKEIYIGAQKTYEIYIREQYLFSDDGILLSGNETSSSFTLDRDDSDEGPIDNNDNLVVIDIFSSNNKYIYHRSYLKFQNVLASVGGLANLLIIAFTLMSYIFSIVKRDETILNKIFDYDLKEKIDGQLFALNNDNNNLKNRGLPKFSYKRASNINYKYDINYLVNKPIYETQRISQSLMENDNSNNLSKLSNTSREKKDIYVKRVLEILKKKNIKYKLTFSFWEIIKLFLFCNLCPESLLTVKHSLYNKSNFVIEEYLDISFIIQKLEEFEKLKIVLFKDEQMALFNFIAKEFISLDADKTKNNRLSSYKIFNRDRENLANLIIDFKEKINSNDGTLDYVDKKLYELLSEEFK